MRSDKQKEELSDLYRGKDLYIPEDDPKQDTAEFELPHMMAEGGYCMAHGGYCMAEGGPVKGPKKVSKVMDEFGSGDLKSSSGAPVKDRKQAIAIALSEAGMSNKAMGGPVGYDNGGEVQPTFSFDMPQNSPDNFSVNSSTDTTKQDGNMTLPKYMQDATATQTQMPSEPAVSSGTSDTQAANDLLQSVNNTPEPSQDVSVNQDVAPDVANVPDSGQRKLSPDQFDDLISSLKPGLGTRIGQGATSGLATLADAIMQGVARAGNPGFEKNIIESRQNQQQNLVNALRAKYETQFRGQELGQGQQRIAQEAANAAETARSHKANEAETEKQRITQQQAQTLAAQREGRTATQEQQKQNIEAAKNIIEAHDKAGLLGQIGIKDAPSEKDYQNALQVMRSSGTASGASPSPHLQAISWARSHPNDPRAVKILQTATSKLNGQ